ncbi:Arc-like DNA binding dprotein [Cupriavidus metallidurans]|uniref:Arc family DNA-binding protein n=1 Tax=Cupriavidus metallidurans TaxID=119219 RepID=UPI00055B2E50|nr:Arc family DNA-binding protein [Cupriavidus metallidurans]MDE4918292.1 Arc family DNA-binding protein [Cupriavidus metallidurans]
MARSDPQVNIRMPAELKASLEEASVSTKRSLNAEIIARLQHSFETTFSNTPLMTAAIAEALIDVTAYANKHGVTPDEALAGLVTAALSGDTEPVYFFVIDKDMKIAQIKEMFAEASHYFPDNGTIQLQARGMARNPAPPPAAPSKRAK